jgi:hypothetical protein
MKHGRLIENEEIEWMWEEVIEAYIKEVAQRNHEKQR